MGQPESQFPPPGPVARMLGAVGRRPVPGRARPWPSGNECLSKPRHPFGWADERELWIKGQ